ncbi:MAG: type II toxin-antitoxin system HicA family toxin [Elusimicrobia bacterium]|nr:type II toxin-antitoxin system HicA family toxin [Elusimicrobiota bacterium]
MNTSKLYEKIKNNPQNVRFRDLCRIVEAFGFRYRGGRGSHRVYAKEGVVEILNFQEVKRMAKPYQVRQFLKIIEVYKLGIGED